MERRRQPRQAVARTLLIRQAPSIEPVLATIAVAVGTTALLTLALQMTRALL